MGNCLGKSEKLTAEIVPHDGAKVYPTVRLYGSPKSILAAYIRFALLHKSVSLDFVPSNETATSERVIGGSDPDDPVTLRVGSEVVSGSRETLLRFIDARFPSPSLAATSGGAEEETTPLMVRVTRLQHKSMLWHIERVLRWAEDLATRGGKKAVDPSVGSPRMEIRKFARSYSELLEVMMEHAQMEETVLFPLFDRADRGLSKAAKEEHARDLPLMNGIKEVIKSVGVLDSGSPDYREALYNLSSRLKLLLGQCKQHFKEEEVELLPLMEALELSKEQEDSALEQCFDVMQGTHGRLLKFLLEGLPSHDAMKYLDLISKCRDKERMESMLHMIVK
ncbi:hemeerythrin-like [Sesbania bispinosa]|nr:hemeerythrin-like [Sesbania bispinosa]